MPLSAPQIGTGAPTSYLDFGPLQPLDRRASHTDPHAKPRAKKRTRHVQCIDSDRENFLRRRLRGASRVFHRQKFSLRGSRAYACANASRGARTRARMAPDAHSKSRCAAQKRAASTVEKSRSQARDRTAAGATRTHRAARKNDRHSGPRGVAARNFGRQKCAALRTSEHAHRRVRGAKKNLRAMVVPHAQSVGIFPQLERGARRIRKRPRRSSRAITRAHIKKACRSTGRLRSARASATLRITPSSARHRSGTRSRASRRSCAPSSGRSSRSSMGMDSLPGRTALPGRSAGHDGWR